MSPPARTILADVTAAYTESRQRFERHAHKGQHDQADIYMSEMQEIERCVHINEISTSWRRTIGARWKREGRS